MSFVPNLIRTSDMPRFMKVLIGESNNFPDMVQTYRQTVIDTFIKTISALLETARDRGDITIGDPKLTTRLLIAPIAFSGMWQTTFGHDPDADVDVDALLDLHAEMFIKAITVNGEMT